MGKGDYCTTQERKIITGKAAFNFNHMCVCVCLYIGMCMWVQGPMEATSTGFPAAAVVMRWLGPQERQHMSVTAEPALQSSRLTFLQRATPKKLQCVFC